MPYCQVGQYNQPGIGQEDTENVQIYYQTYGHGDIKVLLIMGLAATHEAWNHQIKSLAGTTTPNEEDDFAERLSMPCVNSQSLHDFASLEDLQQRLEDAGMDSTGIHVCAFDNRGVGKSSVPKKKSEYTTTIMAMDALALMDHLGWEKAHVFGHSLGGMISCKLAAMFPDRVASLALLSATGGGYQCLPKFNWVLVKLAFRFWKAKSPEERALVDLDTHYTKDYLDEMVGEVPRREHLYKEYVKNISASGMQPSHGQNGHINACWTHQVTSEDFERLRTSSILVSVIHGRGDVIAQVQHSGTIARKLHPVARLVELPGGHLITHQHTEEVNQELKELIQAAHSNLHYSEWLRGCTSVEEGRLSESLDDEEDEDEDEVQDARGCCAFFRGLYRWLACEGHSSAWRKLHDCFSKKKQ
eukprot:c18394_g1_i1 orf=519-1763(-)